MLLLHPLIRLACAVVFVAAIFLARDLMAASLIYLAILFLLTISNSASPHMRFVAFVTAPLLVALAILWGWIIDPHQIPAPHPNGLSYAVFLWLRIVAVGGILQFLFLPLITSPNHLRDFLERTGLSGSAGTLIVTSIVFLPEVRRRFLRIVESRKAQGHVVSGIRGLLELPTILMPLVSSLLDSATTRAELWSHRGILNRKPACVVDHSRMQGTIVLLFACASLAMSVAT